MNGLRGLLVGAFALIALEVIVANTNAANAVGGVAAGIANAAQWFLASDTPAIPDRSSSGHSSSPLPAAATSSPAIVPATVVLAQPVSPVSVSA